MDMIVGVLYGGLFTIVLSNFVYLHRNRSIRRVPSSSPLERPRVSILIPARNEADNLRRLLPSIASQRYRAFETIIFDDLSEDDTADVVKDSNRSADECSFELLRGDRLPDPWIGKSYALHTAAARASGELFLFLDADAELHGPDALDRIVDRYLQLPPRSVLTGFPRLQGRGLLLTSLVPFTIFTFLPWLLVRRTGSPSISALNGQCWLIGADQYREHLPHQQVRNKILEDVEIGRFLKSRGMIPALVDLQEVLSVHMYDSLSNAWRGFRKNAYPLSGGRLLWALPLILTFIALFLVAPVMRPWTLLPAWGLKLMTDRRSGFPAWISACIPVSYLLGTVLQFDSMRAHLRGTVEWKGRRVGEVES